jgi:hypothetical protein
MSNSIVSRNKTTYYQIVAMFCIEWQRKLSNDAKVLLCTECKLAKKQNNGRALSLPQSTPKVGLRA